MKIGIDFGSTMTKFAIYDGKQITHKSYIKRNDDWKEYLKQFDLSQVSNIAICGSGASFIDEDIFGIPTTHIEEFDAIASGVHYLTDLKECIVVCLGTGTSFMYINQKDKIHLGGSGMGGALLTTLARNCCGCDDIESFLKLALDGDLKKADLQIADISSTDIDNLYADATAANMAKIDNNTTPCDYAAGICNLVFQNVGVMAFLADNAYKTGRAVVLGTLACSDAGKRYLGYVSDLFHIDFILPEDAPFGCAIGAVLLV